MKSVKSACFTDFTKAFNFVNRDHFAYPLAEFNVGLYCKVMMLTWFRINMAHRKCHFACMCDVRISFWWKKSWSSQSSQRSSCCFRRRKLNLSSERQLVRATGRGGWQVWGVGGEYMACVQELEREQRLRHKKQTTRQSPWNSVWSVRIRKWKSFCFFFNYLFTVNFIIFSLLI